MDDIFTLYKECRLCPRACGTDRFTVRGACGESARLSIETAVLHSGEEPCISGSNGSGTIFFTGCGLRCIFCQNMEISQKKISGTKYYTEDDLVNIMQRLADLGAVNINFVTPDHYLPHIVYAVNTFRANGYTIPIVYNCSGWETIEHLKLAAQVADIFLIDCKFSLPQVAAFCLRTKNETYTQTVWNALAFLYEHVGNLQLDENGIAKRGVLVRHLVLPGMIENSIDIVNELFFRFGSEIYLSLMAQYTPSFLDLPENCGDEKWRKSLARCLTEDEYRTVVDLALELGFENVYLQELPNQNDTYIPNFASHNMFEKW